MCSSYWTLPNTPSRGRLGGCFSKEKKERSSWHLRHNRDQNENYEYHRNSYLIRPCNAQTDLEDEEDPPPLEPLNSGMFANSSEDFPSTTAIWTERVKEPAWLQSWIPASSMSLILASSLEWSYERWDLILKYWETYCCELKQLHETRYARRELNWTASFCFIKFSAPQFLKIEIVEEITAGEKWRS